MSKTLKNVVMCLAFAFMFFCVGGASQIFSLGKTQAQNATYTEDNYVCVDEIWDEDAKKFDLDNVNLFFKYIMGDENADVKNSSFVEKIQTEAEKMPYGSEDQNYFSTDRYSAAKMRTAVSSLVGSEKDIIVKFGGFEWTPVLLSAKNGGDPVLTLLLAGAGQLEGLTYTREIGVDLQFNYLGAVNWIATNLEKTDSLSAKKFERNSINENYDNSYIRTVVLNNGGTYRYYELDGAKQANTYDLTYDQKNFNAFSKFTMEDYDKVNNNAIYDFIVAPEEMKWQQYEDAYTVFTSRDQDDVCFDKSGNKNNLKNEKWGIEGEVAWKKDKLWLPSLAEVGGGSMPPRMDIQAHIHTGLWELSANQRNLFSLNWLRTTDGSLVYLEGSCTDIFDENVLPRGICPAINLDLTNVFDSSNKLLARVEAISDEGHLKGEIEWTGDRSIVPNLYLHGKKLVKDTDYTVSSFEPVENRCYLGENSVFISAKEGTEFYGENIEITYKIVRTLSLDPQEFEIKMFDGGDTHITADWAGGSNVTPKVRIVDKKRFSTGQNPTNINLYEGTQFDISSDAKNIGTDCTATITAKAYYSTSYVNYYRGEIEIQFDVLARDLNAKYGVNNEKNRVSALGIDSRGYEWKKGGVTLDGGRTPIQLRDNELSGFSEQIISSDQYTISYENNLNASDEAQIIFTGTGNYRGEFRQTFKINPKDINQATCTTTAKIGGETSITYDGKDHTEELVVSVLDEDGEEISNTDYDVTISNFNDESSIKNAANYTIRLNFKNNYTGHKNLSIKVNPVELTDENAVVDLEEEVLFIGNKTKPIINKITVGDLELTTDDYKIYEKFQYEANDPYYYNTTSENNLVKIIGVGNFEGEIEKPFKIVTGKITGFSCDPERARVEGNDIYVKKTDGGHRVFYEQTLYVYCDDQKTIRIDPDGYYLDFEFYKDGVRLDAPDIFTYSQDTILILKVKSRFNNYSKFFDGDLELRLHIPKSSAFDTPSGSGNFLANGGGFVILVVGVIAIISVIATVIVKHKKKAKKKKEDETK